MVLYLKHIYKTKGLKIIMVAVITGASSGIGKETARLFAAKGWQVICLSRTPCDIKGVKSLRCDITKQEDIDAAFSQIE